MSKLGQFEFDGHPVRTDIVDGVPMFVAADVCACLGLNANTTNHVSRLKPSMRRVISINTSRGPRDMLVITEGGVYRLVLVSRKPDAERFKDWICETVVPAIRKTGEYRQPPENVRVSDDGSSAIVVEDKRTQQGMAIVGDLFGKLESVESRIDNRFDRVDHRLERIESSVTRVIPQRKKIPRHTINEHIQVVERHYGGRCPCCLTTPITQRGVPMGTFCAEHWSGHHRVKACDTWVVCASCNQQLGEAGDMNRRRRFERMFIAFHVNREQMFGTLDDSVQRKSSKRLDVIGQALLDWS